MAKTVYTEETIQLQSGEDVTLRPLDIKSLRKFNTKLAELRKIWENEDADEDEAMDVLVDMAGICIARQLPELAGDRDRLEESLDLGTIYKLLDSCGGLRLNDPNQQAAAAAALSTLV